MPCSGPPGTQNSVVAAIDIAALTDVDRFKGEVDRLADTMKGLATVAGAAPILAPGQPEEQVLAERTAGGIPLPAGTAAKLHAAAARTAGGVPCRPVTVAKLHAAAARFGLELPAALR